MNLDYGYLVPVSQIIKERVLPHYDITITALAAHLKISRPHLNNFLLGKSGLSPVMALRLEKSFGISADWMCRTQVEYELQKARQDPKTRSAIGKILKLKMSSEREISQ